jgi:hypothetical protein
MTQPDVSIPWLAFAQPTFPNYYVEQLHSFFLVSSPRLIDVDAYVLQA